jgi:hypothetical protein
MFSIPQPAKKCGGFYPSDFVGLISPAKHYGRFNLSAMLCGGFRGKNGLFKAF